MKGYKAWRKGRLQNCTWKFLSITQIKTFKALWEDKEKKKKEKKGL